MKYDVEITSMDHSGRGIARIDDKIVFIPKTVIGDKCNIRISKIKKNYCEGVLLKLIKPSPKRIRPSCIYFDKCGGCDLMNIEYLDQLRYKEEKIKNILLRYGKVDRKKIKKIIPCENTYFYRNKVTFKVQRTLGFYKKKSYDLVAVDKCVIADSPINKVLNILKKMDLSHVKEVIVRTSFYNGDTMVIFNTTKKIPIEILKDSVKSIVFFDGKRYEIEYGDSYIIDHIDRYSFVISPDSFFQINTRQTEKLYRKIFDVLDVKKDDIVLDLYSGTGTIGIYLSENVKKVIGIEINSSAVCDANRNKELNNISNVHFICGDASVEIAKLKEKFSIVIVDPPRSGLNDEAISNIKKIKAKKFIYVSCDPITLARDIDKLSDYYEVIEITPVDMFCHTYHVECVCVLRLR